MTEVPSPSQPLSPRLESALTLLRRGQTQQALRLLLELEAGAPLSRALQQALHATYLALDDHLHAAAAQLADQAMAEGEPLHLFNIATGFMNLGELAQAEKWFTATLAMAPGLARAQLNLAAVLRQMGRPHAARAHLDQAYARQWLYPEPASSPTAPRVLILCAPSLGNIPLSYLLPDQRMCLIKCYIHDQLSVAQVQATPIPPHEVVLNAIGDPDNVAMDDARLLALLTQSRQTVLNPPNKVAHTRRDQLPARLQGLTGLVVPAVQRVAVQAGGAHALIEQIQTGPLRFPLIVRPAASHGGVDLVLAPTAASLSTSALGAEALVYATEFHDYRSADGYYRKYRMIYIDRCPYPYHLAIGPQWLLHYFSAQMLAHPWKIAEELAFLRQPEAVLGAAALQALHALGQRLDLDYCGVDFSILPDGRVLIFEANATMLVHPEAAQGPLAHKNTYIQTIIQAFQSLLLAKAAAAQ